MLSGPVVRAAVINAAIKPMFFPMLPENGRIMSKQSSCSAAARFAALPTTNRKMFVRLSVYFVVARCGRRSLRVATARVHAQYTEIFPRKSENLNRRWLHLVSTWLKSTHTRLNVDSAASNHVVDDAHRASAQKLSCLTTESILLLSRDISISKSIAYHRRFIYLKVTSSAASPSLTGVSVLQQM